jgi:two-component system response regulator YesN
MAPAEPAVFVVDDDELLLKCILRQLQHRRIRAAGFATARAALARLDERPALLVSDLHLPEMDGLALARVARTQSPATRILLLTGSIETAPLADALRAHVIDEYLCKPWSNDALMTTVERLLGGRGADG